MPIDIGPKIGIEGEAQYRRELNQIIQGQKTLAAESKAVSAAMQDETDAEKKSAAEKDVLSRQIQNQREKLAKLEEGLKASARKYGEADTRTQKWQQAVYNATGELANMEHRMRSTDGQVEEIAHDMGEAEQAASGWGDVMLGTLCADALKKGLSWIRDAVKGIAEKTLEASKAGAAYADDFLTLSTTTGVATDTLQELAYMEGIADVSTNDVAGAIQKLKKTMATAEDQTQSYAKKRAEAAKETDKEKRAAKLANIELGSTAAAYKELGVATKDANGNFRKAEDVFFDMIAALGKIEDETKRDTLAMQLMGKSATDLNPLITAGADSLAEMRQEAHDAGAVLSGPALKALGKQQDAMDRLSKKTETLSNRFAVRLAPSMEKAYGKLNELADSPRVRRGLDLLADGIGGLIDGAVGLAEQALPKLLSVFGLVDDRMKYLTDDQLALVQGVDDSRTAHEEMVASFRENAQPILDETKRAQDLWKELQTMTSESGKVKKKDEERAKYILGELNEALGTEYAMNGRIIQNYQDMQSEVDKLIQKRQAEAMLAAGAESFAKAETERNAALSRAAELAPQVENAKRKLDAAERKYAEALEISNRKFDGTEEGETKRLRFMQQYERQLSEARGELAQLSEEYENASSVAQDYYATAEKWERAQTAAANGRYDEVVRILADEFGATLDYYKKKKDLNEQEKKDLKDKIRQAELDIKEYKKNLEAGMQGFSEAGLQELEGYVKEAKDILDGKEVASHWINGMIQGMTSPKELRKLESAANTTARTVKNTTQNVLQIASPSKVARWMGRMWDEGLAGGIEKNRDLVLRAASQLSGGLVRAGAVGTGWNSLQGNGITTAPLGAYTSQQISNSTTNFGGISVHVDGAGAVNADALAQRIGLRLGQEIQRYKRGGRAG